MSEIPAEELSEEASHSHPESVQSSEAAEASVEESPAPPDDPFNPSDPSPNAREFVQNIVKERDRQWSEREAALQAEVNALRTSQTQSQSTESNVESQIAGLYTDDEVGRRTREAIDRHLELRGLTNTNSLTEDEVRKIAGESAGRVRDQIHAGYATTREVDELVHRNVIGDADKSIVQREWSTRLSDPSYAQLVDNPQAAEGALKVVVYDLIKEGKIKPYSRKRPTNPLQPGGNGSPPPREATPDSVDPSRSPFASVRKMSKEDAERIDNLSTGNYRRAN